MFADRNDTPSVFSKFFCCGSIEGAFIVNFESEVGRHLTIFKVVDNVGCTHIEERVADGVVGGIDVAIAS